MKHPFKLAVLAAALSLAATLPQIASAETTAASGAGALSTSASVDFRINIPRVLRFRVGSLANTVDLIEFNLPAANIGDGTDIAATAASGDLGNGDVTVEVMSNAGQVTIAHDSSGASLSDGSGNTIPYTEILTASSDVANLDAPTLGVVSSTQPSVAGGLTNESAVWTYTFDNSTVYNSGVYGGVNTNGGRVTYTASVP
jgi:hypothetical protein